MIETPTTQAVVPPPADTRAWRDALVDAGQAGRRQRRRLVGVLAAFTVAAGVFASGLLTPAIEVGAVTDGSTAHAHHLHVVFEAHSTRLTGVRIDGPATTNIPGVSNVVATSNGVLGRGSGGTLTVTADVTCPAQMPDDYTSTDYWVEVQGHTALGTHPIRLSDTIEDAVSLACP